MAASLCQCYQTCVRRGIVAFPSSYLLLHNRSHAYRLRGFLTCTLQRPQSPLSMVRHLSGERGGGRKGFLGEFLDNLKQELTKNKEMKENLRKFREEAKKLEESEALQQARKKYKTIESETVKTSEIFKKKLGTISETVKEGLEEVSRTDIGKKIKEGMEEAAKTAKTSAETVSKGGEMFGKTGAFKAISQGVESVKKEIGDLGHTGPYRPPARLRKRSEFSSKGADEKVFEANEEAMGVVLHKDSKWYQQWKDFKDNNVVFNSEDCLSFSALLGSHQLTVTNVTLVITELIPAKLIGSHTDLINVGLRASRAVQHRTTVSEPRPKIAPVFVSQGSLR
ncbi:hypothetical protein fugu_006236 [Takifugu bimaculatus]|uniref:Mitochondrial import inner membrane translocase subunit TIM44 n=1 Tax=Takifugu bimaculatus TaxID=433685 RepID=A0A4Z2B7J6_9TELE|nr:hypothetical protein fugu_006236 [Takifugu bimaculatus]